MLKFLHHLPPFTQFSVSCPVACVCASSVRRLCRYKFMGLSSAPTFSRLGPVARRSAAAISGRTQVRDYPPRLTLLFKNCGLWTCTVSWLCPAQLLNETVKWLASLPILMRKSFWWWACSRRYKLPLLLYFLGFRSPVFFTKVAQDVKLI